MKKLFIGCAAWLAAALLAWSLLSLSLFLVMKLSPPFYPLLAKDRENPRALPEEVEQANYETLIAYNLDLGKKELHFDGLPMSQEGRIHFEEVKEIVQCFFHSAPISLLLCLLLTLFVSSSRETGEDKGPPFRLKKSAFLLAGKSLGRRTFFLSLLPTLLLGAAFLFGFHRAFVLFHQVLFDNDFWIFDGEHDPIIFSLPESFFFNMALLIVAGWLAFSLLLWALFSYLCRRKERKG